MGRITFVTGTDTGVGKTLLTACLLYHLRQQGIDALAMKPFCSGSRSDARLLQRTSGRLLTLDEVNPYYFPQPVAPYVATGPGHPDLKASVRRIERLADRCEHLVVEGAGGILVPLGRRFFVADLIAAVSCDVILVSRNRLGTINHTLLSLREVRARKATVALMGQSHVDPSCDSNARVIQELQPGVRVIEIPYFGANAKRRISEMAAQFDSALNRLLGKVR